MCEAYKTEKHTTRWCLLRPLLCLGLLMLVAANSRATEVQGAADVVAKFHSELISVMKQADSLGYSGRYEKLAEPVMKSHALDYIAKIIMGPNWKPLSKEKKAEFVGLFTQLTIANYAFNFKGYSGEAFKVLSDEAKGKSKYVVRAVLTLSDNDDVSLDYLLKLRNNRWVIVNIIADGVSDLALKRSEYDSIIKKDGLEVLMKKVKEKIDQYARSVT